MDLASAPLLSIVMFLPLVGAVIIGFLNPEAKDNARWVALWTTLVTFVVSLFIWINFDTTAGGFQFVEQRSWLDVMKYKLGVDGISVLFVILTTFLMPLCILASWVVIEDRVKEFMICFLVLETLMIGVFCALDLVLFYVFFEGGLIPMFLIIGIWGGTRRVYATFKFFLYTLLGSVLMLLAVMAMYWHAGTTDIPTLMTVKFPRRDAVVAVARVLRLVRGEAADVAGAHVVAGRARRGADGGLGHPGGDPVEDGRLRLPALLGADVPDREPAVRRPHVRALGHRHHLHLARRTGADRSQEADRLLVRRPHGLRYARHLHLLDARASKARSSRCSRTASSRPRSSSASACSTTACTPTRSRRTAAS